MILQKRHPMPSSSVFIDWLRSPGKAWLHRWAPPLPALEASNDSRPAVDEPVALDIDLALLESLAVLRQRAEPPGLAAATEPPRREFGDGWRTRPNVRFLAPGGVDLVALVRRFGDEPHD
jgi:hypothetical protein